MNRAIKDFESLMERWPGVLELVKALNGSNADCTYEELVALNLKIESDPEGLAIVTRAMLQLMADFKAGDTEVKTWLEEHGFVSDRNLSLQREMDEILEKIESGEVYTSEEFQKMADRLLDIQEECMGSAQKHANSIGRGLFGIQNIVLEA